LGGLEFSSLLLARAIRVHFHLKSRHCFITAKTSRFYFIEAKNRSTKNRKRIAEDSLRLLPRSKKPSTFASLKQKQFVKKNGKE
jgi:hypothetical protein